MKSLKYCLNNDERRSPTFGVGYFVLIFCFVNKSYVNIMTVFKVRNKSKRSSPYGGLTFSPVLNLLVISLLFVLFACQKPAKLYKKEFSKKEKEQLAIQLLNSNYYQGSVPEQFLLQEGIRHNPKNAEVQREIGVAYLKRGFAAKFEEEYGKTIQLDAKEWQGWRGYLYLYFYRDYENALADFNATDTLTLNFVDYPQATSVHFMRAICYLKMEQYDNALAYIDKHLTEELRTTTEDFIDHKTFLYQGIAHYKKGNLENANASFARGIKNAPDNADLWYWTAKLALESGQKEKATRAIEKTQIQFDKEYYNHRPYVEEFFQIYLADIDEMKEKVSLLN